MNLLQGRNQFALENSGNNYLYNGGINIEKKANRTRQYSVSFRVSDREKEIIENKVKQSGMSKTDFLIKALSDKPITVIPNTSEILLELKRQGNNLNQTIKNTYFGYNTESELLSTLNELKRLYSKISEAVGGG